VVLGMVLAARLGMVLAARLGMVLAAILVTLCAFATAARPVAASATVVTMVMVVVMVAMVFVVAAVFVMVTTSTLVAMCVTGARSPVALPQPLPATHLPLIAERRSSTAVHPYFTSRAVSSRKRHLHHSLANCKLRLLRPCYPRKQLHAV
jgi:hypothetical protein